MRAILINRAGGPEVLEIGAALKPDPCPGLVLIRVKAFGINRIELGARRTYAPIGFGAHVLGVEAVGEVEAAPQGEFIQGSKVATAMGILEYQQMGSYAEYISVPVTQVLPLKSSLDWATLGAMPLMFQGAYGSLFKALRVRSGETLLIRGGTTALGLAATALATGHGVHVTGTTRNEDHRQRMMACGACASLLDPGSIAEVVPQKYDKVLDLVGTSTLHDSLRCAKAHGVVCIGGAVGGSLIIDSFNPMDYIPNNVSLTSYYSDYLGFLRTPLQKLVNMVEAKKLIVPIAKVFQFEEIVEAHRYMDEDHGMGKIVITL